jgi:two-component system sensor histidine kinase DctS
VLNISPAEQPAPPSLAGPRRLRRALLWGTLLLLLGVAQSLLVALTLRVEATRAQDDTEAVAAEVAADLRHELLRAGQQLQALGWGEPPLSAWRDGAAALLKERSDLRRIERRAPALTVVDALDTPYVPRLFDHMPRRDLGIEAELACAAARRSAAPTFSRSYYVPLAGGVGQEVVDLCVPVQEAGRDAGYLVGSFALAPLLEAALAARQGQRYELSFVEGDGTRLARAGAARGIGLYVAERVVDLPGSTLQLRADSTAGRPSLIPNLATALVLGLSIALFAVVFLLARDVRRRAVAESALAEALAFRKAMEDSLSTGLRARDLQGAITYVNPAFCAMVGFSADELLAPSARAPAASADAYAPPYWPPEQVDEYQQRQRLRLAANAQRPADPRGAREVRDARDLRDVREAREGYETVFMRKSGERFPVMIYEAPLVDGQGRHTGWMSAVLDVSAQRRVEELSRQQQDRLQASARLATVGEMASLLSHELNQPLAAIASYASGSLNLLEAPPPESAAAALPELPADELKAMLRQAVARIAEQAERAGRIIKSVHGFVRRREQQHETISAELLIEAVLPLVRLQARKSGTRIELDVGPPVTGSGRAPRVRCDRTMIEQVLINLTRNGIQAMESSTPLDDRVLTLRVRQTHERWVSFVVADLGPGIAAEVASRLFTPFFTTRSEGMGLGLSLCRTVIEQHGGALDFGPGPLRTGPAAGRPRGTEFRFTLPAPRAADPATRRDDAETGDTAGPAARPGAEAGAGRHASGNAASNASDSNARTNA